MGEVSHLNQGFKFSSEAIMESSAARAAAQLEGAMTAQSNITKIR